MYIYYNMNSMADQPYCFMYRYDSVSEGDLTQASKRLNSYLFNTRITRVSESQSDKSVRA